VVNATPRTLYPRKRPGTHCIGGWVDPTATYNRIIIKIAIVNVKANYPYLSPEGI
jgi:hypothetical protein